MDFNSLFTSIDLSTVNLVGGALLIVLSFLANGQLNRTANRRSAKTRFVEEQLKSLYGPLYAITQSNQTIYERFQSVNVDLVNNSLMNSEMSTSDELVRSVWNSSVFQPSNLRMRDVVEKNAHLFTATTMPKPVLSFLAHVENWEAVLASHSHESAVSITELIPFPKEFPDYVKKEYERVSSAHAKLIGRHRKLG